MRGFFAVIFFISTLMACSRAVVGGDVTAPGVVQIESPPPVMLPSFSGQSVVGSGDPSAFDFASIDDSFKTIRVRAFPILSVPSSQDPYPVSHDFQVSLYNSRGLEVIDLSQQVPTLVVSKVAFDDRTRTLYLNSVPSSLRNVSIVPRDSSITTTVKWNNGDVRVEYRGEFRIEKSLHQITDRWTGEVTYSSMHWSLINDVSVEDYLYAVVPSEMPSNFEIEALKAQAVAARTYAFFHSWIARNIEKKNWDVDPTTWYQSYRGALVENSRITPAVIATQGQVLTYNGRLIEAFFSSNSGGVLCSVSECFGLPDRPYITGKPDVVGVREKPGGTWVTSIHSQGIDQRLRKMEAEGKLRLQDLLPSYNGPQDLEGLEPFEVGPSGRIKKLQLVLKNGQRVLLNTEVSREMRWQFGMKTNFYEIAPMFQGTAQNVIGYGLGHGVGMSQWGAQLMAQNGELYDAILKFYYDKIAITQL